jgi:hypothetical protein
MGLAGPHFEWVAALEQFQLESDRKAILKLKLLAFLVWSTSATADDALEHHRLVEGTHNPPLRFSASAIVSYAKDEALFFMVSF